MDHANLYRQSPLNSYTLRISKIVFIFLLFLLPSKTPSSEYHALSTLDYEIKFLVKGYYSNIIYSKEWSTTELRDTTVSVYSRYEGKIIEVEAKIIEYQIKPIVQFINTQLPKSIKVEQISGIRVARDGAATYMHNGKVPSIFVIDSSRKKVEYFANFDFYVKNDLESLPFSQQKDIHDTYANMFKNIDTLILDNPHILNRKAIFRVITESGLAPVAKKNMKSYPNWIETNFILSIVLSTLLLIILVIILSLFIRRKRPLLPS